MSARGAHWFERFRERAGAREGGAPEGLTAVLSASGAAGRGLGYEARANNGGRLVVTPREARLDALRHDGALEAGEYWYSPWEDAFSWPVLDVEIVNGSGAEARFTEAVFAVASSRTDPRPVPAIHGAAHGADLTLDNLGWGPMEDGILRFHLETPEGAVLTRDRTCALDRDGHPRNLAPLHAATTECGARRGTVQLVGTLEYTQTEPDGARTHHAHPYRAPIVFAAPPVGAPAPPTAPYQVPLRPDGGPYTVRTPVSLTLPPGASAHLAFTLGAPRSSLHDLSLSLRCAPHHRLPCGAVTLELFCSRADARTLLSTPR